MTMKNILRLMVFMIGGCWFALMTVPSGFATDLTSMNNLLQDASPQAQKAAPVEFHGIGKIDRMGAGEIVIDDNLFKLSSFFSFNGDGEAISTGSLVGYVLETKGVIKSIWKLKAQDP
jgi:hypothetical protein